MSVDGTDMLFCHKHGLELQKTTSGGRSLQKTTSGGQFLHTKKSQIVLSKSASFNQVGAFVGDPC